LSIGEYGGEHFNSATLGRVSVRYRILYKPKNWSGISSDKEIIQGK